MSELDPLTIKRSETIGTLVGALAAAQLKFGTLVKTHENTYTGKKYADLADVIEATQPALASQGLSVIQFPIRKEGAQEAGVLAILAHSSGEFFSVELILPATMKAKDGVSKFDQQSLGSAFTYARRYTWQALVGIAAEEDDDGNDATDRTDPRTDSGKPKTVKAPPVSTSPAKTGGERPKDKSQTAVEAPASASAAPPANATEPEALSPIPRAVIPPMPAETTPVESTSSQSEPDQKPAKSQFDTYTARAIALKQPLEAAGLKPGKGRQTGAKLKDYLLTFSGAKELTDLNIGQWEAFFAHAEPLSQTNPQKLVNLIEGEKK